MPVSDDHAVEPIAWVGAHEADIAKDAVVANDAVVILPLKLPVLLCEELETTPAGNVTFALNA
jgi:hypothetical protein